MEDIKLYFYNGLDKPYLINAKDIIIKDNYLGDITKEFQEEYKEMIKNYTIKEMEDNQLLYKFNVWINPTREMLEDFNISKGIPKESYLTNFA